VSRDDPEELMGLEFILVSRGVHNGEDNGLARERVYEYVADLVGVVERFTARGGSTCLDGLLLGSL
jgi:hypothetical protein